MFEYGNLVILRDATKNIKQVHKRKRESNDRTYMFSLKENGRFSSQYGYIEHSALLECSEGDIVRTTMDHPYIIYKPTYMDYVMNIKRQAQIIYPKDSAVILMWGDIGSGQNVLEAGTGQGALSIAILRALGGKGTLTSYEIREDFAAQSADFIKTYFGQKPENHKIEVRDIYEGIEGSYDRVLLDLPEPWRVVPHLQNGLKNGGIVISYIPTIVQATQMVEALKASGSFSNIETAEFTRRPWKVDGLSVRPEMWIYNHSAFIISARKITI